MLFNFFLIYQIVFEILSFSPKMQICLFYGIVKNRRIFAGKMLFFNKNKKNITTVLKINNTFSNF